MHKVGIIYTSLQVRAVGYANKYVSGVGYMLQLGGLGEHHKLALHILESLLPNGANLSHFIFPILLLIIHTAI